MLPELTVLRGLGDNLRVAQSLLNGNPTDTEKQEALMLVKSVDQHLHEVIPVLTRVVMDVK